MLYLVILLNSILVNYYYAQFDLLSMITSIINIQLTRLASCYSVRQFHFNIYNARI